MPMNDTDGRGLDARRDGLPLEVTRDVIRWNEEMVRRYDIEAYYRDTHPLVRWVEGRRIRALVSFAGAVDGVSLLEVGCGAGHVLEHFEPARQVGLDLSATMLLRSRSRLGPETPLVRGSADRLPFAEGSFSVIICTELLEHTPDPEAVVAELLRVAGRGGRVVVSVPNEVNIDRAKWLARRIPGLRRLLSSLADEDNEWHLHRMDLRVLRSIVGDRGTLEQVRRIPAAILPLRYVAVLRALPGEGNFEKE